MSYRSIDSLIYTSGLFHSLVYDFFIKSFATSGYVTEDVLLKVPDLTDQQKAFPLMDYLMVRTLRLNSISHHYNCLWKDSFRENFKNCSVKSLFPPKLSYEQLSDSWVRDTCIRNQKQREQALCEIDAIVALLFGIDKQTLLKVYRSQFGVLQKDLQDFDNQRPDDKKYHFPRYEAMSCAYDQFQEIVQNPISPLPSGPLDSHPSDHANKPTKADTKKTAS